MKDTSIDIEQSILKTVCFFDLFDYPLTPIEIWRWLWWDRSNPPPRLLEILTAIEKNERLQSLLVSHEGFFYLRGKDDSVDLRKHRYLLAEKKFRSGFTLTRWFRFFPFIEMIAVCNTLGFSNAEEDSDIDLLIITRPGRIWTTRFFTVLVSELFGARPKPGKTKDKLCLSFFLASNRLTLETLKLPEGDPYLTYWMTMIVPIYDPKMMYQALVRANGWIHDVLPNTLFLSSAPQRQLRNSTITLSTRSFFEKILRGFLGNAVEHLVKSFQLRILPKNLKRLANQDTRVVLRDDILKFHDNDRREEFRKRFHDRYAPLSFS